jgi:hypothetical protein
MLLKKIVFCSIEEAGLYHQQTMTRISPTLATKTHLVVF